MITLRPRPVQHGCTRPVPTQILTERRRTSGQDAWKAEAEPRVGTIEGAAAFGGKRWARGGLGVKHAGIATPGCVTVHHDPILAADIPDLDAAAAQ
jgi:hypothetical protein